MMDALAALIWRRVYRGPRWRRWLWFFMYGRKVTQMAEFVMEDDAAPPPHDGGNEGKGTP
jgi:hypothetical protein